MDVPNSTPDSNQQNQPETNNQPPFARKFKHFTTRTETKYAESALSILSDRGIENRLFENLVEFLPDGAIIAGGFVTSVLLEDDKAHDIDFFFTSQKAFNEMIDYLLSDDEKVKKSDGAWAYMGYTLKDADKIDLEHLGNTRFVTFVHPKRPALQLLRMVWYDSPEHVIDTFDLSVVQFAATPNKLTYNPAAFLDLSRKRLVLHRIQFPASTLRRIIKYSHKGFYACPGSLAKICEEIQKFSGDIDINEVVYVD